MPRLSKKFESKRLAVITAGLIAFLVLVYTTKHGPIEIATAMAMLLAPYLTAESIKPSKRFDNDLK